MTREEIKDFCDMKAQLEPENEDVFNAIIKALEQEPQSFKWCTDCKEYNQEKHCCHRYSKVIRDAVAEIRQEPKIKVLDRDEAARKLGTVDVYKASAWVTLLKDLEYLGMKICEVDNGNNNH